MTTSQDSSLIHIHILVVTKFHYSMVAQFYHYILAQCHFYSTVIFFTKYVRCKKHFQVKHQTLILHLYYAMLSEICNISKAILSHFKDYVDNKLIMFFQGTLNASCFA